MAHGRAIGRALAVVCVVALVAAVTHRAMWQRTRDHLIELNKQLINQVAKKNAEKVAADHEHDRGRLKAFAKNLGSATDGEIQAFLKRTLLEENEHKWLRTRVAGVAYSNGKLIRYAMKGNDAVLTPLAYKHNQPGLAKAQWFGDFMQNDVGEEKWLAPYYGETSRTYILEYGVPFAAKNGRKAGVIYMNYSIENLRQVLSRMELGKTGYAFIVNSPEGAPCTIVAHPFAGYLHKNAIDVYTELQDQMKNCLTTDQVIRQETERGPVWLYATKLEGMGQYKLIIVLDRQAMVSIARSKHLKGWSVAMLTRTQSNIITAVLIGVALCTGLTMLILASTSMSAKLRRRLVVATFSATCLGEIIFLWCLYPSQNGLSNGTYVLKGPGMTRAAVKKLVELPDGAKNEMTLRETGIFVQSLQFKTPYEVKLTGYVWQKKNAESTGESEFKYSDDSIVVLPEAEQISISKKYENDDVVGAYFETVLRQPFEYSKYPFDYQDIWVRMWPANFAERNSVLAPDFDSYVSCPRAESDPSKTFAMGVEEDVVLEGWHIDRTYFSYVMKNYSSNFASKTRTAIKRPELHFNIRIRRRLGGVMISHILPITIVAVLLFGVVMIKTEDPSKSSLLGFSVAMVLGYCASLFFVLIVSHISLRNTLATPHFVYLEGFYFVMYFQLLLVSMYDLAYVFSDEDSFIRKDSGALQKLLYWPTLTCLIFLITLYSFF